jgi:NAD(P)-dependent dehydrogenase (short-subunit alcohol dehydrogenase family)
MMSLFVAVAIVQLPFTEFNAQTMQDLLNLSNKHVLVTGASSGIGRQMAVDLSRQGVILTLTGRDAERLQETADACDGEPRIIAGDLVSDDFLNQLVVGIDPIDGMVYAAGGLRGLIPFRMLHEAHYRDTLSVNMDAPIWLTQKLLKQRKVKDDASLVYVSAIAAYSTPPATAVYSVAKAGLIAAIRSLGQEMHGRRVRCNALALGYVKTPLTASLDLPQSYMDKLPSGMAEPEDVTGPALFLLSQASRWITRQVLVVDGGVSLKYNISV